MKIIKNTSSHKNSSSQYLGVTYYPKNNKWRANIYFDKKLKHLGYFILEIDAVKAYNAAATVYHGDFANLNLV